MASGRSVITVGNFDGVHRGHRALLDAARRLAEPERAEVVAVSFTEHPLTQLKPDRAPPALMDTAQRQAALLEAGADRVEWLKPTPEVLGLSPEQFVEKMVAEHDPVGWVEGPDFRFGKKRAGDMDLLGELGERHGYTIEEVEPVQVTLRDKLVAPVSSTLVRWLVANGRVADAQICTGRSFAVRGPVVEGERRGREIGFPTANLDTGERLLPADGVYAGAAEIDGVVYPAAVSVGVKPTFGEHRRVFEAYLLDFEGALYGRTLAVKLLRWLRDQWPFPDADSLVDQMNRDVAETRRLCGWRWPSAAELAEAGAA